MKLHIFMLLCTQPLWVTGQTNSTKIQIEEIRVKNDSTARESLAFLEGYEWTIDAMVNGQSVSTTRNEIRSLIDFAKHINRKSGVIIYNIKRKKPDGKFLYLTPKRIIVV